MASKIATSWRLVASGASCPGSGVVVPHGSLFAGFLAVWRGVLVRLSLETWRSWRLVGGWWRRFVGAGAVGGVLVLSSPVGVLASWWRSLRNQKK